MSHNDTTIYLGTGLYAIVDPDLFPNLVKFNWLPHKRKRSIYAYTDIVGPERTFKLFMHRLIACTPPNRIVHHKNGNSLDNRRCNLENMSRRAHKFYHLNNPRITRFEVGGPEYPDIPEKITRKKAL